MGMDTSKAVQAVLQAMFEPNPCELDEEASHHGSIVNSLLVELSHACTMVFDCAWTWIANLWDNQIRIHKLSFTMPDLPDEILIDILSRLPGYCVLECRRVCKRWLALTSTSNFVEMHLKKATSVLLLQVARKVPILWGVSQGTKKLSKKDVRYVSDKMWEAFILDEGAKANKMFKKMGANFTHLEGSFKPRICGSCDGLFVFCQEFPNVSIVYNPLTGEKVSIRNPVQSGADSEVCGFFFHPILKDYRLLFVHKEGIRFRYFMYSLGSQLWRKLDDFSYRPASFSWPAILNGALHWTVKHNEVGHHPACSNSIMIFNMETEEFRHMLHPGKNCSSEIEHYNYYIFERQGKLAFCYVSENKFIYVWVLEDYENWIWEEGYLVNLHLVNLHLDVKRNPFKFAPSISLITLLDIQDDELLFRRDSSGGVFRLFRYNMHQNTFKQISGVGVKKIHNLQALKFVGVINPYTMTFVSPSGFK